MNKKRKRYSSFIIHHLSFKNGFTLVELMVVIAIIGIMTGVVTVSMKSSIDKSKKASALTTASSVLPELVTCADDGGHSRSANPTEGELICCKTAAACSDIAANQVSGHTAHWPAIAGKTGWSYEYVSGDANTGNYVFNVTKDGVDVACSMIDNGCGN
jgi:prepilin-type N-terminal cleavage/methylation domain-containing protein